MATISFRCFSKDSVEGILAALKAEDSEWANKYLKVGVALQPGSCFTV